MLERVYQNFKTLGGQNQNYPPILCEEDNNNPKQTLDRKRKTNFFCHFMDPFEHPDNTTEGH